MTSNCLEVQDNLSAWLDGELAPEVMIQVERHLEGCAGCRRELALLTTLDQALGSLTVPVPAGLPEKVRARLQSALPPLVAAPGPGCVADAGHLFGRHPGPGFLFPAPNPKRFKHGSRQYGSLS